MDEIRIVESYRVGNRLNFILKNEKSRCIYYIEHLDDGELRLLERVEITHAQFFYAELMRRPKQKEKELINHAVKAACQGLRKAF